MAKWRRQLQQVKMPFLGINRSLSSLDLKPQEQSKASGVVYEQGFARKREGRLPVGDTLTTPLNGEIKKLYIFKKLDGTQRLMAWTNTKVYAWPFGASSWTDITGSASFNFDAVSVVTYVNKVYFTGNDTGNIYSWDIGDSTVTDFGGDYTGQVLMVYGERLNILNTYEGATWNRQRHRRSNVGNTTFDSGDFVDLVSYMGEDEIVDAGRIASSFAFYGRNLVLECSYTGSSTEPFAYTLRTNGSGLACKRGLVVDRAAHYHLSGDGLKVFDLSLVSKAIDFKINNWFFDNVNKDLFDKCVLTRSEKWNELILYYPGLGSQTVNKMLVYQLDTGIWTEGDRGATAATWGTISGQLTIDELQGTIDSLTGTIDGLGAPIPEQRTYIGDENGVVYIEFEGTNLGTLPTVFDWQTMDFNFDDDSGAAWQSIEFEAKGDSVTVMASLDEGKSWFSLHGGGSIDDLSGTIDDLEGTIDGLGSSQALTSDWKRYRLDFEEIGKKCRFRFWNGISGEDVQIRWFRYGVLPTSSGGTLPE